MQQQSGLRPELSDQTGYFSVRSWLLLFFIFIKFRKKAGEADRFDNSYERTRILIRPIYPKFSKFIYQIFIILIYHEFFKSVYQLRSSLFYPTLKSIYFTMLQPKIFFTTNKNYN